MALYNQGDTHIFFYLLISFLYDLLVECMRIKYIEEVLEILFIVNFIKTYCINKKILRPIILRKKKLQCVCQTLQIDLARHLTSFKSLLRCIALIRSSINSLPLPRYDLNSCQVNMTSKIQLQKKNISHVIHPCKAKIKVFNLTARKHSATKP